MSLIVYKLLGQHESGEHEHDFGIFTSLELAEKQMEIEKGAYTWNGKCNWIFWIEETEVRDYWKEYSK